MKSAFELALERTGGILKEMSEEKKALIAEIELKQKAKIAEAELAAENRIAKARKKEEDLTEIQENLVTELASINYKFEKEKDAVRNG